MKKDTEFEDYLETAKTVYKELNPAWDGNYPELMTFINTKFNYHNNQTIWDMSLKVEAILEAIQEKK